MDLDRIGVKNRFLACKHPINLTRDEAWQFCYFSKLTDEQVPGGSECASSAVRRGREAMPRSPRDPPGAQRSGIPRGGLGPPPDGPHPGRQGLQVRQIRSAFLFSLIRSSCLVMHNTPLLVYYIMISCLISCRILVRLQVSG